MRESRDDLTARWLDRISQRVSLHPNRVFPTEELLDHVPLLIDGMAEYIEHPSETVSADAPVVAKARELGALRYEQGFDEYEILKEYEILGGILFAFLAREVETIHEPCTRGELLACAQRMFQAVTVIQQATATHYLQLTRSRLAEREERLTRFNRAITHELRNHLGAVLGALDMLGLTPPESDTRTRMLDIAQRNVRVIQHNLDNLVELSRLDERPRQQRHVPLASSVSEVARQLRDMARAAGVEIRIGAIPSIEVAAAGVELVLTNLISNAIKYADPDERERWVAVSAEMAETDTQPEVIVSVRDNGIGVPETRRARLFDPYYRAHADVTDIQGTGVGLSLVRETVTELGGRAWAEFPERGTIFRFTLPARRDGDHDAGGAA